MFCWLASTPTIIQLGCQARFNISTDSSLWRDPAGNAIAFNNCSHLQQHHPATAVFPAIQTPFKINLSSKNIISCKMNHRALFLAPLFLFLAPVVPLLRIIYSNCPTQNSGAICCPWEDLWIQILFGEKEKKKFIYLAVSWQIRAPRLRANEPHLNIPCKILFDCGACPAISTNTKPPSGSICHRRLWNRDRPRLAQVRRPVTRRHGQLGSFRPSEALSHHFGFHLHSITCPFPSLTNCFSKADETGTQSNAINNLLFSFTNWSVWGTRIKVKLHPQITMLSYCIYTQATAGSHKMNNELNQIK